MSTEQTCQKKRNKKKNNRFMQNVRGFAKQGNYGRGFTIDSERFSFFIKVLDILKITEDTAAKCQIANNAFENIEGSEIEMASNQVVSRALESLLAFLEESRLEHCFNTFGEKFRPIFTDKFASHVLQKMVIVAFLRGLGEYQEINDNEELPATKRIKLDIAQKNEEDSFDATFTEGHRANCRAFVLRVAKFMLNNLEEFVWDSCANHVMRSCILCLAGIYIPKVFGKPVNDLKNRKLCRTPDEWHEILLEYPRRLEMWPQFNDFPYEEHSSALLGVICVALHRINKSTLKHFGKKVLNAFLETEENEISKDEKKIKEEIDEDEQKLHENYINESIDSTTIEHKENMKKEEVKTSIIEHIVPRVFTKQSSIVLLQTMLNVAGAKLFIQLYAMLFQGRIKILSMDNYTYMTVQSLLQNIKEKDDFELVFDELEAHIEELLRIGHTGVIFALSSTCLRLSTKQSKLFAALQKSLHIYNEKDRADLFFQCLVKLKPYKLTLEDKTNSVCIHGSLVIQNLLQFNKPISLVNCILETAPDKLISIFSTPNGSHIVDAFFQSKFIGEKSREKLIRHLEGFYVDLATTKHGSRVVEQCFAASHDPQKARIVKELADKSNLLKGNPFGTIIFHNLKVGTYICTPAHWLESLKHKRKKPEELFKDILN